MNNNFMRQGGQGNRQRSRGNRNRHRGGGGGGGGGGNSANKVFDSNGPDVKLRGTAQTIAEKYMQLGRDSQSSGDNVAAESYYQHAEHYYRIWAANQPQGASLQMTRKLGEEEYEEDGAEDGASEDEGAEGQADAAVNGEMAEGQGEQLAAEGGEHREPRQNNNNNNGNNNRQQRSNNRERFRPRWQNRNERGQDGNPEQAAPVAGAEPHVAGGEAEASGQWEAPSFLQRPAPAPALAAEGGEQTEAPPRRFRPRREREETAAAPESSEPVVQSE